MRRQRTPEGVSSRGDDVTPPAALPPRRPPRRRLAMSALWLAALLETGIFLGGPLALLGVYAAVFAHAHAASLALLVAALSPLFALNAWTYHVYISRSRLLARDREVWATLATRLGLSAEQLERGEPDPDRLWRTPRVALRGQIDGAPMALYCEPSSWRGLARCEIRAPIRRAGGAPLPWTRLAPADAPASDARPLRLGDPLLDRLICVEGRYAPPPPDAPPDAPEHDAELARRLLTRDALRGPLLAVLHQWPGARIEPDAVVIERQLQRTPPMTPSGARCQVLDGDLEAIVGDALALSAALGDHQPVPENK